MYERIRPRWQRHAADVRLAAAVKDAESAAAPSDDEREACAAARDTLLARAA